MRASQSGLRFFSWRRRGLSPRRFARCSSRATRRLRVSGTRSPRAVASSTSLPVRFAPRLDPPRNAHRALPDFFPNRDADSSSTHFAILCVSFRGRSLDPDYLPSTCAARKRTCTRARRPSDRSPLASLAVDLSPRTPATVTLPSPSPDRKSVV